LALESGSVRPALYEGSIHHLPARPIPWPSQRTPISLSLGLIFKWDTDSRRSGIRLCGNRVDGGGPRTDVTPMRDPRCLAHPHDHSIYPSTSNVKPRPRVPYHDHPPTLYKLNFISMHSVPLFKNIQTKPAHHTVWIPSTICSDLYANPPPDCIYSC